MCLLCALSYSLFYEKESAREKKSPMSRDVCVGKKHVSYGYVRLTRLINRNALSLSCVSAKSACVVSKARRALSKTHAL